MSEPLLPAGEVPEPEQPEAEPFVLIEDFLKLRTHGRLLDYTLARQADFTAARVVRTSAAGHGRLVDPESRVSSCLVDFPGFQDLFIEVLYDNAAMIGDACALLGVPPFTVDNIECHLTAHGDGAFFKPHFDTVTSARFERKISFVYYFFREPKAFEGGNLRVYHRSMYPNAYIGAYADFEPKNNSLVLFASDVLHEVLPVRCTGKEFGDCRFTVNGWLDVDTGPV
jgi:SM-20-related protein